MRTVRKSAAHQDSRAATGQTTGVTTGVHGPKDQATNLAASSITATSCVRKSLGIHSLRALKSMASSMKMLAAYGQHTG